MRTPEFNNEDGLLNRPYKKWFSIIQNYNVFTTKFHKYQAVITHPETIGAEL